MCPSRSKSILQKSSLDIYIASWESLLHGFSDIFWVQISKTQDLFEYLGLWRGHGFYKLYLIKGVLPLHLSSLNVSLTTNWKWMNAWSVVGFKNEARPLNMFFFLVGGFNRTQKHSRKSKIGSSGKNSQQYFALARNYWQPPPSNNFDTQPRQPLGPSKIIFG